MGIIQVVGKANYFTTSGTFTSTNGTYSGGFIAGKGYDNTGYLTSGIGFGSAMSPATLLDGKTIKTIFEYQGGGPFFATTISIGGFSSDPGSAYFGSITVNGVTKLATDFAYTWDNANGTGQWTVNAVTSGVGDPFTMPSTGSVSWTLTNYV